MSDAAVDASFHLSFFVAEVHASSLAVSEYLAMGTYSGFHPFVVAELSERIGNVGTVLLLHESRQIAEQLGTLIQHIPQIGDMPDGVIFFCHFFLSHIKPFYPSG
mgnify:CR=1 FL=1